MATVRINNIIHQLSDQDIIKLRRSHKEVTLIGKSDDCALSRRCHKCKLGKICCCNCHYMNYQNDTAFSSRRQYSNIYI